MTVQLHALYLAAAYAALGTLLLVILAKLAIPRTTKIAAIAAMAVFNVAVFFWTQDLLGWSAATAVPERFQVLWMRVVEPNPSKQFAGAIHLWVEELDENNIPSGQPRAFVVPYSTALATKAAAAQAEIKEGNLQGGTRHAFTPTLGTGAGVEGVNVHNIGRGAAAGGDPSGGGLFDPAALGGQSKSVDLIPLPKPLLPPKDDP